MVLRIGDVTPARTVDTGSTRALGAMGSGDAGAVTCSAKSPPQTTALHGLFFAIS